MKMILSTLMLLNVFILSAQSFSATTAYMYITDDEMVLVGNLKLLSGVIKKTDTLAIYAETGRKFTASIQKITDLDDVELSEVNVGQYATFRLLFTENPSKGKDYVRDGYKVYPISFNKPDNIINPKIYQLKSTLDGKSFNAKVSYKGALYFKNGIKGMKEIPYLQLQIAAVEAPDERLLTIQIFNPKENNAKYNAKDLELNFSGTPDGNKENTVLFGFVNGKAVDEFNLEITKWEKNANKVIISGKFSGMLSEVLILGKSKKKIRFENAVFEGVELEIFEEMVDFNGR